MPEIPDWLAEAAGIPMQYGPENVSGTIVPPGFDPYPGLNLDYTRPTRIVPPWMQQTFQAPPEELPVYGPKPPPVNQWAQPPMTFDELMEILGSIGQNTTDLVGSPRQRVARSWGYDPKYKIGHAPNFYQQE